MRLITVLMAVLLVAAIPAEAKTVKFTCTLPAKKMDGSPLAASDIVWINLWTVRANGTKNSRMISWKTCGGAFDRAIVGMRYAVTATASDKTESPLSPVVIIQ